jgi:excisionase family DNA binding protein
MQSISNYGHSNDEPLLVKPKQACRLLSCGNTRLYELLNSGEIASFRDGGSRKIVMASLKNFIERRLSTPSRQAKRTKEARRSQLEGKADQ